MDDRKTSVSPADVAKLKNIRSSRAALRVPCFANAGSYQVTKISAWITDLQGNFTAKQTKLL